MIELDTSGEIVEQIVEKIEFERLKQNISQKDLASRSGISYGTYRNLLDIKKISLINFISIFQTLGLYTELGTMVKKRKPVTIKELKEKNSVKKRASKRG